MPKKKQKKEKEILVDTSILKRREELLKDTTGAESYTISKISTRLGRFLSYLMAAIGLFFLTFSVYVVLTKTPFPFLGSEPLFFGILGFLGVTNILCGLILLAKE